MTVLIEKYPIMLKAVKGKILRGQCSVQINYIVKESTDFLITKISYPSFYTFSMDIKNWTSNPYLARETFS